jgi:hypothetical protein
MSTRTDLIKAEGLVTYYNELDAPQGAQVIATNVNIDETGVITKRRGFSEYLNVSPEQIKQLIQYKGKLIRHYGDVLQYEGTTFTSFTGSYNEMISGLRIKYQEAQGNLYFTTLEGIKKISVKNASEINASSIQDAGVQKATYIKGKTVFTVGGFLPPQSKVAYRVLFGKKDANNNVLLGSPSGRIVVTNTTEDTYTYEKYNFQILDRTKINDSGVPTAQGDYIVLNAKDISYVLWFKTAATNTEPVDSITINKTRVEVDITGLATNLLVAQKLASVIINNCPEFDVELGTDNLIVSALDKDDVVDPSFSTSMTVGAISTVNDSRISQGSIQQGQAANVDLTFSIPSGIDTTNFFQIYRTGYVTASESITITDIDPGDEMNLVYEEAVPASVSSYSYQDDTPELFRQSGTLLYTNPLTGGGISSSNEVPPLAHDITLFKNYTFYSNTKTRHRSTVNMLSVDNFQSGITDLVIGGGSAISTYVFQGIKQEYTVTLDIKSNTADGGYLLLDSANDERSYYLYFKNTTSTGPVLSNKIAIQVDLNLYTLNTIADMKTAISDALLANPDFEYEDLGASTIKIKCTNNGKVTAVPSKVGLLGAWDITTSQTGTGEDALTNKVLISALPSTSQAIAETAQSLISVINQDANSPVTATYLSGEADLPGIILFESKVLEDVPFFIGSSDSLTLEEYSPKINLVKTSTVTAGITPEDLLFTFGSAHGYNVGDSIYISTSGLVNISNIKGKYTVKSTPLATTLTIDVQSDSESGTATVMNNELESDNEESPNRVYYSKYSQPEAVPSLNYVDVDTKDDAIERIVALRDNLFIFKPNGIYILSGFEPPFNVRLLDNSSNLVAPDSAVVLNNQIFAMTKQGIATITESGVALISRKIENLILDVTTSQFDYKYKVFGVGYENDRAYLVFTQTKKADTYATQCFRYNIFEQTWTKWTVPATCGLIRKLDDKAYFADPVRKYVLKERKDRAREDHADRNFDLFITSNAVNGAVVRLSDISEVTAGDVIVQTQYVTISRYNQLLRQLDNDPGIDSDYESTLEAVAGISMAAKLNALNTKLMSDDLSGTITAKVFQEIDPEGMMTKYNLLMQELNSAPCDTNIKSYAELESPIALESVILSLDINNNNVTLDREVDLIQGTVVVYKAINSTVQWNPLHFGNPSGTKQVPEGTIMFDQNNFTRGTISYSSDLSPGFVSIPFNVKGLGYWGSGLWGGDTFYWGGEGNDVPVRTIVPREKQRCRYINVKFDHMIAREGWRIVGISLVVRPVSSRGYR